MADRSNNEERAYNAKIQAYQRDLRDKQADLKEYDLSYAYALTKIMEQDEVGDLTPVSELSTQIKKHKQTYAGFSDDKKLATALDLERTIEKKIKIASGNYQTSEPTLLSEFKKNKDAITYAVDEVILEAKINAEKELFESETPYPTIGVGGKRSHDMKTFKQADQKREEYRGNFFSKLNDAFHNLTDNKQKQTFEEESPKYANSLDGEECGPGEDCEEGKQLDDAKEKIRESGILDEKDGQEQGQGADGKSGAEKQASGGYKGVEDMRPHVIAQLKAHASLKALQDYLENNRITLANGQVIEGTENINKAARTVGAVTVAKATEDVDKANLVENHKGSFQGFEYSLNEIKDAVVVKFTGKVDRVVEVETTAAELSPEPITVSENVTPVTPEQNLKDFHAQKAEILSKYHDRKGNSPDVEDLREQYEKTERKMKRPERIVKRLDEGGDRVADNPNKQGRLNKFQGKIDAQDRLRADIGKLAALENQQDVIKIKGFNRAEFASINVLDKSEVTPDASFIPSGGSVEKTATLEKH